MSHVKVQAEPILKFFRIYMDKFKEMFDRFSYSLFSKILTSDLTSDLTKHPISYLHQLIQGLDSWDLFTC